MLKLMRRWEWVRSRRGAAAVEYGLILPVLLLFMIGAIDIGRLMWTYTTLNRATEAAARCGAIDMNNCATTAQIQTRAVNEAWGLTVTASAFTPAVAACGVQVVGTYSFAFAIPALVGATPLGTITLQSTACYPIMNTPSGGGGSEED